MFSDHKTFGCTCYLIYLQFFKKKKTHQKSMECILEFLKYMCHHLMKIGPKMIGVKYIFTTTINLLVVKTDKIDFSTLTATWSYIFYV
jgi:hypothetical protein